MKKSLFGFYILISFILTGCLSYYRVQLDVPRVKSEEAWSRGVSYIVRTKLETELDTSKKISVLKRFGNNTLRTHRLYYIDTYHGKIYFSMNREVYLDRTRIFITSLYDKNINEAENCKNYILGIVPKKIEPPKKVEPPKEIEPPQKIEPTKKIEYKEQNFENTSTLVRKEEYLENFEQAELNDIPPQIMNELLKVTTKNNIEHRLETYRVSKKEVKNYNLKQLKKLFGIDK